MRQRNKTSLQNGVRGSNTKTVFVAAYPQLKELWDNATHSDGECTLIDYPLEEEGLPDSLNIPNADELVLLLPDDIRSHILLRYLARDFKGEIFIVPIIGQYMDMAPLAVSDTEFEVCIRNIVRLADSKRSNLCAELSEVVTNSDCFWKLQNGKICSLSREIVYDYILELLTVAMKESFLVGLCMGNAPKGWPTTDVFYLNRIDDLIHQGRIAITKVHDNPFKQFIAIR